MTAADYHADRTSVSASSIKLFGVAPCLWQEWRNGEPSRPSTPALTLGRMVHTLALEPAEFGREFSLIPADAPRRPSITQREAAKPSPATVSAIQWWDGFEAEADGKEVVDFDDFAKAEAIANALQKDAGIGPFLRCKGEVEKTIYFVDEVTGIQCKARLDKLILPPGSPPIIFDIKTSADASLDAFRRNAVAYGYHIQAAHYCAAAKAETGTEPDAFYFGVVETSAPFLTHLFKTSPEFLAYGKNERARLMTALAACMESGHFPGYCAAPEGFSELTLPAWVKA